MIIVLSNGTKSPNKIKLAIINKSTYIEMNTLDCHLEFKLKVWGMQKRISVMIQHRSSQNNIKRKKLVKLTNFISRIKTIIKVRKVKNI